MKLVSLLTPSYWPGLKALAHSLGGRGNVRRLDWIVATEKPAPPEWGDWLHGCGFRMVNVLLSELEPLPAPLPRTEPQFEFNWNKLRLFGLPAGEYIFLDADMLCMKDASEMLAMPSISAVGRTPGGAWISNGINAGFIRFDASRWLLDECLCVLRMNAGQMMSMAEQAVINIVLAVHPELWHNLPSRWNMPTKALPARLEEAVFLHFIGMVKPWNQEDDERGKIWRDYRHREYE
jgi:hypothetical protein